MPPDLRSRGHKHINPQTCQPLSWFSLTVKRLFLLSPSISHLKIIKIIIQLNSEAQKQCLFFVGDCFPDISRSIFGILLRNLVTNTRSLEGQTKRSWIRFF